MEARVKELDRKLRVLEFAVKRSQEIIVLNSSDVICRHENAIVAKIQACHTLKNAIEEERIEGEESEDEVTNWASSIEEKLKAADQTVQELRRN
jgi:GTPase involved in cell partitioning and DNA repair